MEEECLKFTCELVDMPNFEELVKIFGNKQELDSVKVRQQTNIPQIELNALTPWKMNKKMFILEMEKGKTQCETCPFSFYDLGDYYCCNEEFTDKLNCRENDLSTIQIR